MQQAVVYHWQLLLHTINSTFTISSKSSVFVHISEARNQPGMSWAQMCILIYQLECNVQWNTGLPCTTLTCLTYKMLFSHRSKLNVWQRDPKWIPQRGTNTCLYRSRLQPKVITGGLAVELVALAYQILQSRARRPFKGMCWLFPFPCFCSHAFLPSLQHLNPPPALLPTKAEELFLCWAEEVLWKSLWRMLLQNTVCWWGQVAQGYQIRVLVIKVCQMSHSWGNRTSVLIWSLQDILE